LTASQDTPPAPPGGGATVRPVALALGLVLLALGVLGLIGGPIVGRPASEPLVVTGPGHDILHLILGALFIHVAFGLAGRAAADGLTMLGLVSLAVAALTVVSPDLLGLLGAPANLGDQLLHVVIGGVAIVVGRLARSGRTIHLPGRAGDAPDQ
jgi:hypothetical protein